jgi:hypothetical protein
MEMILSEGVVSVRPCVRTGLPSIVPEMKDAPRGGVCSLRLHISKNLIPCVQVEENKVQKRRADRE